MKETTKRSWLNWKTLALVAIGLVILGPLFRQAISLDKLQQIKLGSFGLPHPAPQSTPQSTPNTQSAQAPPTTMPTPVTSGKHRSSAASQFGGSALSPDSEPTVLLNPGMIRPGTKVAITGFGFDPGSVIDVVVKNSATSNGGNAVARAQADATGGFSASFSVPEGLVSKAPTVVAQERHSSKVATTQAQVPAGMATVKLNKMVGKPGDMLTLTAAGFLPEETVKVYWGQISGDPAATLHADEHGVVAQSALRIPVGAVGNSELVLIGSRSQSVAMAQFLMLQLYPSVKLYPYAVKAAHRITLSGKGFAPGENVLIYVNSAAGRPLMIVQADAYGSFAGVGFTIPFGLKKSTQSLILLGEQSRAMITTRFMVLPYMPSVQPSTWGGFAGTTLSFFASGFAANEVALVYKGNELVSAFRVNSQGAAAAAGQYRISSQDQGRLTFRIVGATSGGVATAVVTVQMSDVPVQIPPQPKYTLPADLQQPPPTPPGLGAQGQGQAPQGAAQQGGLQAPAPPPAPQGADQQGAAQQGGLQAPAPPPAPQGADQQGAAQQAPAPPPAPQGADQQGAAPQAPPPPPAPQGADQQGGAQAPAPAAPQGP